MKRAKTLPTSRAPLQAQNAVRELCDSIEAAARGDVSHAGSDIRRAVTRGVKLFMAGAIDGRGAALINDAAARANKALRARAQGAQVLATAQKPLDNQRRINLLTSVVLPPDQSRSVEDERFDTLLDLLTGAERTHQTRNPTA